MPGSIAPRVALSSSSSLVADRVASAIRAAGASVDVVDASDRDLKARLDGASALVHLGHAADLAVLLDAVAAASVPQVVFASSATVYGAWPDNAVPLTEDVPLRPNPGFEPAASAAEGERLLAEWADDHPGTRIATLRLATLIAPDADPSASAVLAQPSMLRAADALPPIQVLHVDDATSAVLHALDANLHGTFNVAPDGFANGDTARALSAAGSRLPFPVPLPEWLVTRIERVAAGATPYRAHPWVIANDRLRATGWSPAYTTEEAIVACREGSWWRELSPHRRQHVALGASAGVVAAVIAAVASLVARRRRRVTGVRPE